MKKLLSFLLTLILILNLAACGAKAPVETTAAPTTAAPTTEVTEPVTEPPTEPPTEPEPELPDPREMLQGALGKAMMNNSFRYFQDQLFLSHVAGYLAEISTTLNAYGKGDGFICKQEISVIENIAGDVTVSERTDKLIDGVYSYCIDDGEEIIDETVQTSTVHNAIITGFHEPEINWEYVEDATVEDLGSRYYMEFTYGQQYVSEIENVICTALSINSTALHTLVESYEMTSAGGYALVEKATGALIAFNEHLQFDYVVQGETYAQMIDTYIHVDLDKYDAYKNITGVPGPVAEPEELATPAFYHVTGEDGQELWLLGTIHIGDGRTCYLPQEVYDAFDQCDALAVEVDTEYMETMMDDDEAFAAEMQANYYYEDGSSIREHVSEDVYADAVAALKRSGDYRYYLDDMTAAVWSTQLDQSRISLGNLSYDYGVDSQMIARAYAQDKEVISLEAFEDHLSIGIGCSDRLQELLLISSIQTDVQEYLAQCDEMFEVWCRGDEAELRESLAEEEEDLTDEDIPDGFTAEEMEALLAEYDEYMMGSRNPKMMEKAREFLESGKVVMYCVGVAHVLGVDNIVDYLIAQGYTVEKVEFAK